MIVLKGPRGFFGLGMLLLAALQLSYLVLWPVEKITKYGLLSDDAFYYTVTSRNFWRYGFYTLDGVMPTNGFQPLWEWILTGLLGLPFLPAGRVLTYLTWGCFLLFVVVALRYLSRHTAGSFWVTASVFSCLTVLNVFFQSKVVMGLETPLLLVTVFVTLLLVEQFQFRFAGESSGWEAGVYWPVLLGSVSVLCFFARTDLFVVSAVLGGWLIYRGLRWKVHLVFWSAVLVPVAVYLTNNVAYHGGLVPISGRVKRYFLFQLYPTWSGYLNSQEWKGFFSLLRDVLPIFGSVPFLVLSVFVLGVYAICLLLVYADEDFPVSLRLLGLVTLMHLFFLYGYHFELRSYSNYYFVPEFVFVALVLSSVVGKVWENLVQSRFGNPSMTVILCSGLVGITLLVGAIHLLDRAPRRYWTQRLKLAKDIDHHVPEDTAVGAFWGGTFAQFSDRTVVPLDGVVGSYRYFKEVIRNKDELAYLVEHRSPYLAIYSDQPLDEVLNGDSYRPGKWSYLGLQRLSQWSPGSLNVVSHRPVGQGGWYLLELK